MHKNKPENALETGAEPHEQALGTVLAHCNPPINVKTAACAIVAFRTSICEAARQNDFTPKAPAKELLGGGLKRQLKNAVRN
jgi:hypothetical protein